VNTISHLITTCCRTKHISIELILAVFALFLHFEAGAELAVQLFTGGGFAVLSGAGITVTGPTTITGDIGSFPTPTITGFENVTQDGVNHTGDAVSQQARIDLITAYDDASGRTPNTVYSPIFDLGGLTLTSGVYNDPSSFFITGILTLDAGGDPGAVWIFQAGSTLITAENSSVALVGGALAANVFWQVGSSATLGAGTDFSGNILALQSVTLNADASVVGRVSTQNGAVTLDNNTISLPVGPTSEDTTMNIPEPNSVLLFYSGLVILLASQPCDKLSRI